MHLTDKSSMMALAAALLAILLIVEACSKLKDLNPIDPPGLGVHPAGWLNPDSASFHGNFIKESGWNLAACRECHGQDYAGGIAGKSCLACHPGTPEDCLVCHGGADNTTGAPPEDLRGLTARSERGVGAHTVHMEGNNFTDGIACAACHRVPEQFEASGHIDTTRHAEVTFGDLALSDGAAPQWDGQTCQNAYCHGSFELGNKSNAPVWTVSDGTQAACGTCHGLPPAGNHPAQSQCSTCHGAVVNARFQIIDKTLHINGVTDVDASASHPDGWIDPGSPNFHGLFIRNSGWDLNQCQQCHGTDYAGGNVGVSCLTCHPQTPEGCVVCHGGNDNMTGAPPEDIDGNQTTEARGVGAHTVHLTGADLSAGFDCDVCHTVPTAFNTQGHADSNLPAELKFGGLATANNATPQWDGQTCQNAYCHGSFELGNKSNAPVWTVSDGSQAACGTCHGLPPEGNHPTEQQCSLCHPGVVDANNRIIDKDAHIDGTVQFDMSRHDDLFFPIFSGEHRGKWDECSICHVNPAQWNDFSCLGCHKHRRSEMEKEHRDVSGFVYESRACYACHPDGKKPRD